MKILRRRKFNGKVYCKDAIAYTIPAANKRADQMRKIGYRAKVVKTRIEEYCPIKLRRARRCPPRPIRAIVYVNPCD